MNAMSLHCSNISQLEQAINSCCQNKFEPTLAIVFSSIQHNLEEIGAVFSKYKIDVIGCSTAGEIVDRKLYENSLSVLLMDTNKGHYKIKIGEFLHQNVYQSAFDIGQFAKESFAKPGLIVVSGGLVIDAEALVAGFRAALTPNIPIYGGLAADDLRMEATYAFTNFKVTDQGLAVLIFDTEKIKIQGLANSGWEPVGVENVITKAEGNVVYTINNEPAFQLFSRYFGFSKSDTNSDQLITLQTNYPFQFIREEGYSILRSPILVNEDLGTITLAASVKEGDKFRFSYSPGFEIIEQTIGAFDQLQKKAPEADALILFSCKGRHGAFGPMLEKEIKGIFGYWDKPMIGFLSYGEIGDIGNGICEFHNETCSLVLLKEK